MSWTLFWRSRRKEGARRRSTTSSASRAKVESKPLEALGGCVTKSDSEDKNLLANQRAPFESKRDLDTLDAKATWLEHTSGGTDEETPTPVYQATPERPVGLPVYNAYEYGEEHPDFPRGAIVAALRASHPPRSSFECGTDKREREETEEDQGQLLRSVTYGDQLKRGVSELERFREEQLMAVQESSGMTAEEIERRRKLSRWDETEGWN